MNHLRDALIVFALLAMAAVLMFFVAIVGHQCNAHQTTTILKAIDDAKAELQTSLQRQSLQIKAHDDRYPWWDQNGEPMAAPGEE